MKITKICLCIFLLISLAGCKQYNTNSTMKVVHLDCGRKYFSKETIQSFIDVSSHSNVTHIQLAFSNDGCRFLLDDMSIESYDSNRIKSAIHEANEQYADFEVDELNQSDMDEIIAYAKSKNIEIIPLLNSPGHMNAILSCIEQCIQEDASFDGSKTSINLKNEKAIHLLKSLIEKYIQYFSSKGCAYFSIGGDEVGNDIYPKGSMGFGQLIKKNEYHHFIDYINSLSKMIKSYKMIPMAFNDGIYFQNHTEYPIDTDIVICYWSYGDIFYRLCSAKKLDSYGFKLINTNSKFYFVSNNPKWKCTKDLIKKFNIHTFQGSKIENPYGAMFCIWCDDPLDESEQEIFEQTKEVIQEF